MNHPRTLLALVAVALACLPSTGAAVDVEPTWQAGGPEGGYVADLAFAPSEPGRVYALTAEVGYYQYAGHIFVSTDAGASWEVTGSASVSPVCQSMAVDPLAVNRLYASFWLQGVFRTQDGGKSWTAAREGLPHHPPHSDDYGEVYLLAASRELRGTVLAAAGSDVFVTRDSGASWTAGFDAGHLDFMTWSPGSPEVAYLGGQRHGLVRSTDGGNSWQAVAGLGEVHPRAIAFHPTDPSRLWVGALGVYRSTDGGLSWELHTAGLEEPKTTKQVATITSLAVDLAHTEQLVAASWATAYASSDGGLTWARFPDSVSHLWLTDLEASPEPGGPVLAAAQDLGVYRFENGEWAPSWSGLYGASIWLLAADPARSQVAIAAVGYHPSLGGSLPGLYRTTDGGHVWTTVRALWGSCSPETFAVDPGNGNHVLVSDCEGEGLAASTDGGASWSLVDLPGEWSDSLGPIVFAPSEPERVYAFRLDDVLRSDDRGATWQVVNTEVRTRPWPLAAAVHPLEPEVLYAGLAAPQSYSGGAVAKSTDGGETWANVSDGLPCWPDWSTCGYETVTWLGIHPDRPNRIWAVVTEHGLYVSEDGAASWHASSVPVLAGGVALVPGRPDTVVVGDKNGGGIVVSDDGGQTWRELGASLGPSPAVFALASSPNGELVYAGTSTSVLHLHGLTFRRPGGRLGAPAAVTPIPVRSSTAPSESLTVPRRAPALAR